MPPPTVLLVEDEDNDVILIRRAFRKANIAAAIQVVDNGEDAIEYLARNGAYADREQHPFPELVLLDLKLPRKSGLEVLGWIRAQPDLESLVVVVLTSSRQSSDVEHAYALHANSYLVKPVSPDDMQELIKTLGLYWLTYNEAPVLKQNRDLRFEN